METKHTLNRHTDCRECLDQHAALTAALDQCVEALEACLARFAEDGLQAFYAKQQVALARAALDAAKKARGA